jgi:hypothetical protein
MLVACLAACAFAAAAPPNDAYPGTTVDYGADVTGTTAEATAEDRDTPFANLPANTVWYAFTSATDRWTTVDTCGSALDTQIAIAELDGAIDDDSELCHVDEGSSVTFLATAGTTYHVLVDGYNTDVGSFNLHVKPDTQPPDTAVSGYSSSGWGLGSSERSTDASFDLLAYELGAYVGPPLTEFECSLDGAPFSACATPVDFHGLALGDHEFRARAIDPAGNRDDTPSVLDWTILGPADDTVPEDGSPGLKPNTRAAHLTLRATPSRDRHKPYTFKVSGRLVPRGNAKCTGKVSVQLKHGTRVLMRRGAKVAKSCAYSARVRTAKRGKLKVAAHIGKVSASVSVRAG